MALQETRMVMIEKIEDYDRGSVSLILGHVDTMVFLAKVGNKNEVFLNNSFLANKWVRKILEQNRYRICRSVITKKEDYISWK